MTALLNAQAFCKFELHVRAYGGTLRMQAVEMLDIFT